MTEEQVRAIIREEFQKNYISGTPKIPPHTHNGVDNLRLPATSIIGNAVTGNAVTKIIAGTNISIAPITGVGEVTVNASGGGGGGSPGGSDTEVQFNDSGSFGGDSAFTWTKSTNTLTLDDGSADGTTGGDTITGGTSRLSIITGGSSTTESKTGDIRIETGSNTGTYSYSGNITLQVGAADSEGFSAAAGNIGIYAGNSTSASYSNSGNVFIKAGTSNVEDSFGNGGNTVINAGNSGAEGYGPIATGYGNGGNITLNAGVTSYSYSGTNGGSIYLNTTFGSGGNGNSGGLPNGYTSGKIIMNVHSSSYVRMISRSVPYGASASGCNLALGSKDFGGGEGVISIQNAKTNPSSSVTSGGILYVTGGALTFRGSSGTVTVIAPA